MRDAILAKLAEVETMLAEATCDGEAIAECETVEWELTNAINALAERIDYYVD